MERLINFEGVELKFKLNAPQWAKDEILKGNDDPALCVFVEDNK